MKPAIDRRLCRGAVLIALIGAQSLFPAAWAGQPAEERPEEILSWRHNVLAPERYVDLAAQWEAFVGRHPADAAAWVEWGDALRYSGRRDEAKEKYDKAFEVDSTSAPAVSALCAMESSEMDAGGAWPKLHGRLLRAMERDPSYGEIYYTLWKSSLILGDEALAGESLREMVRTGDMPRPLFDYGHNMIMGAPQNAVLLTNGDNDTYPPLAYQALTGLRPDVTIVNLALLNTSWYIHRLHRLGVPMAIDEAGIDGLKHMEGKFISAQVQELIFRGAQSAAPPRPLFYSVTVPKGNRVLACKLVLEGLGQRIVAAEGEEIATEELDVERTRELLDLVYRIEGMTDPLIDWRREGAVASLGKNYAASLWMIARHFLKNGRPAEGGAYGYRAAALLAFQHDSAWLDEIFADWAALDPASPLLARARALR
jgi:tetratricopeptide (TPR) repeat protein